MTKDEWTARVQVAVKSSAEKPSEAAAELIDLADKAEAQLNNSFSQFHVTEALSIAASILDDMDLEQALQAVTRQTALLKESLVGVANHLSSAASHQALLLAQLGRLRKANTALGDALNAAALAPNPNLPLELAMAELRKRAERKRS